MANKLGFETVAEGVETKEQFNYLRDKNIDIIQGYLLGKPISKVEFEKLLIRQIP
jgi:EAL domain-containing protein (putative c-di-GMP-specific phosphodiesterase class I)